VSINFAPFDDLQTCESVAWHLNVYRGDWRVPARRYRDWAAYDEPVEQLKPFVAFAHGLGFRVMLHVNQMPRDLVAEAVICRGELAMVRTRSRTTIVADLAAMLDRAHCGSRPFDDEPVEVSGPLASADGARFQSRGDTLFAHPPWMARRTSPETGRVESDGTGVAYARFEINLPREGRIRFLTEVAMDQGALGPERTDGVTFGVAARSDDCELRRELHNATDERRPLELDLTPLAGKPVTVELTVHPGPNRLRLSRGRFASPPPGRGSNPVGRWSRRPDRRSARDRDRRALA